MTRCDLIQLKINFKNNNLNYHNRILWDKNRNSVEDSKRLTFRMVFSSDQKWIRHFNTLWNFRTFYFSSDQLTFYSNSPNALLFSPFFFFSSRSDRQEIWNWGRSIRDKSRKLGETFSSTIELQRVSRRGLRGNCVSMINREIFNIWKLSYDHQWLIL